MKIIDIGKCIDNKDPLGIGRIRFSRYNDYTGEVERAFEYEPWDDRDIFVANPFLPNNINFIPEIGQSVKIMTYNADNDVINIEYIAGPFNTMYDYNGQTFSQQVSHTTYGIFNKRKPNIFTKDGEYVDKKTEHAFAKENDFAIYGKNGSDILMTDNGLVLRGGKLLSKQAASEVNRTKLLDFPIMSKKTSKLFLKKFPKKMVLEEVVSKEINTEFKDIKYIVEYSCRSNATTHIGELYADDENPMYIDFYIYKVTDSIGNTFKTNFFSNTTLYQSAAVKLINDEGNNSSPTFTVTVNSITNAYAEIRHRLYELHDKGFSSLSTFYKDDDIHPFYFKPTTEFANRVFPNNDSVDNRLLILNNINVLRVGPNHGLIFDKSRAKPKTNEVLVLNEEVKIIQDSPEQTFGAITADKIYFLSTDLGDNALENPVPFYNLNEYEYTQADYIKKIDKSSYSTVRGENLLRLLNSMINVIFTHRHNPLMPIVGQYDYEEGNELKELFKTIENDILNKSIRIN